MAQDSATTGNADRDIDNRQAQRKAGSYSDKAYMTQVGVENRATQQGYMGASGRAEASKEAAKAHGTTHAEANKHHEQIRKERGN